jgi:hypothetical protein
MWCIFITKFTHLLYARSELGGGRGPPDDPDVYVLAYIGVSIGFVLAVILNGVNTGRLNEILDPETFHHDCWTQDQRQPGRSLLE